MNSCCRLSLPIKFFFLLFFGLQVPCNGQWFIFHNQEDLDTFDQSILTISGDVKIVGEDIHDLTPLSNVKIIGGDLVLTGNRSLQNFIGLDSLHSIGGSLSITHNAALQSMDGLGTVTSIGGGITLWQNYALERIDALTNISSSISLLNVAENPVLQSLNGLKNIYSVEESVSIFDNAELQDILGLQNISSIGGELQIHLNPQLQNLIGLERLSFIGQDLNITWNGSLSDLGSLSMVETVNGAVSITYNTNLKNIDGLSGITSVQENVVFRSLDSLENLDGLANLTSINGYLIIRSCNSIENLDGLMNIQTLSGGLWIQDCSSLKNIDGVGNVRDTLDYLKIQNVDALENINALKNITWIKDNLSIELNGSLSDINGLVTLQNIGRDLTIYRNPNLADCCGIKELIVNESISIGGEISVESNGPNCDSPNEVIDANCSSYIYGNIFYDLNRNSVQDLNENPIPKIEIVDQLLETKFYSNSLGVFIINGQVGKRYSLKPNADEPWEITTDSTSYNFNFDPDDKPEITFGLFHNDPQSSCDINITSESTRCNTDVEYFVSMLNDGFTINSGEVHIVLDHNVSLVSSSVQLKEMAGKLVYVFDTLYPFQNLEFTMLLDMPSEQFTGEVINVSGQVFYDGLSGLEIQDSTNYQSIVLCSYDPNDKQVSPVGVKDQNYTLHDSELQYTVRFQNTGNAAAIDVTILDTLSENLDLETFKVVSSSFPVNTTLSDRAVEFYFQDIWLIDSLTNEPESHGFVSYTIEPKTDLPEETVIENTAHIIFDFNPAIITNTTKNTMVENLPSCPPTSVDDEEILSFSISPNPFQEKFDISIEHGQATIISVFDINGELILINPINGNRHSISLENHPTGIYILKLKDGGGKSSTQKIVKI